MEVENAGLVMPGDIVEIELNCGRKIKVRIAEKVIFGIPEDTVRVWVNKKIVVDFKGKIRINHVYYDPIFHKILYCNFIDKFYVQLLGYNVGVPTDPVFPNVSEIFGHLIHLGVL